MLCLIFFLFGYVWWSFKVREWGEGERIGIDLLFLEVNKLV